MLMNSQNQILAHQGKLETMLSMIIRSTLEEGKLKLVIYDTVTIFRHIGIKNSLSEIKVNKFNLKYLIYMNIFISTKWSFWVQFS